MGDVKILIKLQKLSPITRVYHPYWTHLCYIDEELYKRFLDEKKMATVDLNQIISKWCKEDFGINLVVNKQEDLDSLKSVVKAHYESFYPELYRESKTDRQGWVRIWITKKMKEELKHGE